MDREFERRIIRGTLSIPAKIMLEDTSADPADAFIRLLESIQASNLPQLLVTKVMLQDGSEVELSQQSWTTNATFQPSPV